jgi:predicted RNase H-like nuclease (RuvC/YqgF family)
MNQTKIKQQERIISKYERHHHNIEGRVRELERHNQYLETENKNLRKDFLRLKTHGYCWLTENIFFLFS